MKTIYITIGNSDDKLKQAQWSKFYDLIDSDIRMLAKHVHGAWHSLPNAKWQNACWCVDIEEKRAVELAYDVTETARLFQQDSVAWAEIATDDVHFLKTTEE